MKRLKNPSVELKRAREAKAKQAERDAKIARMSEREKEKLAAQKQERARIRKERIEKDEEESKTLREKRKQEEEEFVREEELRMRRLKDSLSRELRSNDQNEEDCAASSHRPIKRKTPASTCKGSFFSTPSWAEINKIDVAVPLPPAQHARYCVEDIKTMSTYRVLFSDNHCGSGLWGEEIGSWCRASHWASFIRRLNMLLQSEQDGKSVLRFCSGEYNCVANGDELAKFISDMPTLFGANGDTIAAEDVVFRITRPDTGIDDDGDSTTSSEHDQPNSVEKRVHYRYKMISDQCLEMKFVLDAAAAGFGVPCYACFCFPAATVVNSAGERVQLYGSLYVLKRASQNLNVLASDKVRDSVYSGSSVEMVNASVRKGVGSFVRNNLLLKLVMQAKLNVLNLDCKPGNIMVCRDKSVFIVDFDASMCCDVSGFSSWQVCLFVNLLLLCVHVRCWHCGCFADAFILPLRPLLVELAMFTRGSEMLINCNVLCSKFTQTIIESNLDAQRKLQSIVYAYFVDNAHVAGYKLSPKFVVGKPLVPQLFKFVFDSDANSENTQLRQLFGEL